MMGWWPFRERRKKPQEKDAAFEARLRELV